MRRHSSECFNKHRLMWSVSVSGTRVSCCWSIAWCQWNSFIYIVIYIVLFVPLCWCSASVFDILCVVTVCLMTLSNSAFPCINLLSLRLSYRCLMLRCLLSDLLITPLWRWSCSPDLICHLEFIQYAIQSRMSLPMYTTVETPAGRMQRRKEWTIHTNVYNPASSL